VIDLYHPLRSLQEGHWFKLICGASFQHLPTVRSLALAYTLAGADCVDVAADPAVVMAAREGLDAAFKFSQSIAAIEPRSFPLGHSSRPWLMVSLNDGEDPHFRKATFDPKHCPADCKRPCEAICPAGAIVFADVADVSADAETVAGGSGVIESRCYGCGRCLPVCPVQAIEARSHIHDPGQVLPGLMALGIEAIELHTQVGHFDRFAKLWQQVRHWLPQLRLLAISCPDGEGPDGETVVAYLQSLYALIADDFMAVDLALPGCLSPGCLSPGCLSPGCLLLWQADGRPMSGDIGAGTTHTTIKYAQRLFAVHLPGYIQLAGGTNHYTVPKLEALGLLRRCYADPASNAPASNAADLPPTVAGVAYGSYSRTLLASVLQRLEERPGQLEDHPQLLTEAIQKAASLVHPLKPPIYRILTETAIDYLSTPSVMPLVP
jgi:Fe-S-cluster-containing hydrogenase component 2